MNIEQLKYIVDLSITNSMNETAKRMFVTQPAVSKSIQRLEAELGRTLLTRTKTGIAFTDDGELVLKHAQEIVKHHEEILIQMKRISSQELPIGKLVIGAGRTFSVSFLSNLIGKFQKLCPQIDIQLLEVSPQDALTLLTSSVIDFALLGIRPNQLQEAYEQIHMDKLYTDDCVAVMANTHPLAPMETLTTESLMHYQYTMVGNPLDYTDDHTACHISNNILLHQKYMLEEGTYCRITYNMYQAHFDSKQFVAKKIVDLPSLTNYLAYHKKWHVENSPVHQAFIETTLALAKEFQINDI